MKYSLDTAKLELIKEGMAKYPIAAFSMNPSIAVRDLKGSNKTFLENVKKIRETIGDSTEFYVQAVGETTEEMVRDAKRISEEVSGNLFVKIPAGPNGFKAIEILKSEGIKVACTAVMSVNQALLAAAAGADIIAVYVNRIDNNGGDGIELLEKIVKSYNALNIKTEVSAASIKNAATVEKAALVGVTCVAVNLEVLAACANHPLTQPTLTQFKKDWEDMYGAGTLIHNMEK